MMSILFSDYEILSDKWILDQRTKMISTKAKVTLSNDVVIKIFITKG